MTFHLHGGMHKSSRSMSISRCRGMSYGSYGNISAVEIILVDANCVSGYQQDGEWNELELQRNGSLNGKRKLCVVRVLSCSVILKRFGRKWSWPVSGYNSGNGLKEMRIITKVVNKGNSYLGLSSKWVTFWIQVRSCTARASLFCLKL